MNTREIAREYRLSHWAQIMQERNASGLSIKAYCRTSGLRESEYFYWQRKLREAACQELVVKPTNAPIQSEKLIVPNGWAVCESSEITDSENQLCIEIGSSRVMVNKDVDAGLLTKVCRVLKSL